MNLLFITYSDNSLIFNQARPVIEGNSAHKVRVISFNTPNTPVLSDINIDQFQNMDPELVLPGAISFTRKLMRDCDLAVTSYGLPEMFQDPKTTKLDGDHGIFGDIKLWLELRDKPKIGWIFPSPALFSNLDWYRKAFLANGIPYITHDIKVFDDLKDDIQIRFIKPLLFSHLYQRPLDFDGKLRVVCSKKNSIKGNLNIENVEYINISNMSYGDSLTIKKKANFGHYPSKFNPGFSFFEDIAMGIKPMIFGNDSLPYNLQILEEYLLTEETDKLFYYYTTQEEFRYDIGFLVKHYAQVCDFRDKHLSEQVTTKEFFDVVKGYYGL